MFAGGIFGEDDHVELIGGGLYRQAPTNPPHALAVYLCGTLLHERIDAGRHLLFQKRPVIIDSASELEPDLVVVGRRGDLYGRSHPSAPDVSFVIEVADDSLRKDRKIKLPRYAAAGISEYWIVNLRQRQLERYTSPESARPDLELEARYAKTEVHPDGENLAHPTLGDIGIGQLLPPPTADAPAPTG